MRCPMFNPPGMWLPEARIMELTKMAQIEVSNGRGAKVAPNSLSQLAIGKMVSTDLEASRIFYEEFMCFDCVRHAPGRMLLRDRNSKKAMEAGDPNFFLIEVEEVPEIVNPQNPLNHWGFTVESPEEVDRIRAAAIERQEEFGIRKIMKITGLHRAYGFYMQDRDMNWWEIEHRTHGMTNEMVFEGGDMINEPSMYPKESKNVA